MSFQSLFYYFNRHLLSSDSQTKIQAFKTRVRQVPYSHSLVWDIYININGESVNKEQSIRSFMKGSTEEVAFKLSTKNWDWHTRQMEGHG